MKSVLSLLILTIFLGCIGAGSNNDSTSIKTAYTALSSLGLSASTVSVSGSDVIVSFSPPRIDSDIDLILETQAVFGVLSSTFPQKNRAVVNVMLDDAKLFSLTTSMQNIENLLDGSINFETFARGVSISGKESDEIVFDEEEYENSLVEESEVFRAGCWRVAGFLNITCPSNWQEINNNVWMSGSIVFEVLNGSDSWEDGEINLLISKHPEWYSSFSNSEIEPLQPSFYTQTPFEGYERMFYYDGRRMQGIEHIIMKYTPHISTDWVIFRIYGPADTLSAGAQPYFSARGNMKFLE